MGETTRGLAIVVGWLLVACNAADDRVDPGDLELRDLLGISPEVAAGWDGAQRAAAREVLAGGLAATPAAMLDEPGAMTRGRTAELRIAGALATLDRARDQHDQDALALVRIAVDDPALTMSARGGAVAATMLIERPAAAIEPIELWLDPAWAGAPRWERLPAEGLDVVAALVRDGGHAGGAVRVTVAPVPRLAVIAAYVEAPDAAPRLLVNPVLLAAFEPAVDEDAGDEGGGGIARLADDPTTPVAPAPPSASPGTGGNPYSFYGSVAECASAQLRRCNDCMPRNDCAPVTDTTDGSGECMTLTAAGGRGAFLLCANLSLSITAVGRCVSDEAPQCSFTTDAAHSLATLEENARFIDEAACGGALDRCLADIYGEPSSPFPGVDGGPGPVDPRDTSVSCSSSCDDDNTNCSPGCGDCEKSGPSCNNSLSCDSGCSNSNEQSGCGGNCEACDSSGGAGGNTGGGCGGCDSDSGSGGGGSCDSCSNDSSSGGDGSCGSCSNESSGASGSCDGDTCSGDSGCSGGDGGGGCGGSGGSCGGGDSGGGGCGGGGDSGGGGCGGGGGGSGNSCNVGKRGPPPGLTLAIAILWALLPIPAAAFLRRSRRRRTEPGADPEPVTDPDSGSVSRSEGPESKDEVVS